MTLFPCVGGVTCIHGFVSQCERAFCILVMLVRHCKCVENWGVERIQLVYGQAIRTPPTDQTCSVLCELVRRAKGKIYLINDGYIFMSESEKILPNVWFLVNVVSRCNK